MNEDQINAFIHNTLMAEDAKRARDSGGVNKTWTCKDRDQICNQGTDYCSKCGAPEVDAKRAKVDKSVLTQPVVQTKALPSDMDRTWIRADCDIRVALPQAINVTKTEVEPKTMQQSWSASGWQHDNAWQHKNDWSQSDDKKWKRKDDRPSSSHAAMPPPASLATGVITTSDDIVPPGPTLEQQKAEGLRNFCAGLNRLVGGVHDFCRLYDEVAILSTKATTRPVFTKVLGQCGQHLVDLEETLREMISNCDEVRYGGQERAVQNLQYLHMMARIYGEEKKFILRGLPVDSAAFEYYTDARFKDLSALAKEKRAEISLGSVGHSGFLLIEANSLGYGVFSDSKINQTVNSFREKLRMQWLRGDSFRYKRGKQQIKALTAQCYESQSSEGGKMEVEDDTFSLLPKSEHSTTLAPSCDEDLDDAASQNSSETEWVDRLIGDEDHQLPYLEDVKNTIFEFKHLEPLGVYKENARQWTDYSSLDEHDMRNIEGHRCYEVERPSTSFSGSAQLAVAFEKVGNFTWDRLEVEFPHKRDALHSLVMKDMPTILDECYALAFDWTKALKEKIHKRGLFLRVPDRLALFMKGYLDDSSPRSELLLEERRYVMAYLRACVFMKEQLPLSFLTMDSDPGWANAPGLFTAAFQYFKCLGLAQKKEGREIYYKVQQGMAVQEAFMAVMGPWYKKLMAGPAPSSLRYFIEMEKKAVAVEVDSPADEREERFLDRLRMYLRWDMEVLLKLQPARDGPSLLVPGTDTRFAHNRFLLLYDMLEHTGRRDEHSCPRKYHEFFMDVFELAPDQMEYLMLLDDKRIPPSKPRKGTFDESLHELWDVRLQEQYLEEFRVRLAEKGVVMEKPMVHEKQDWGKWLREGDHTEPDPCTRAALFFRKDNAIRYDIAARIITAKKAIPHFNGTKSDPWFYPDLFGPNKHHLEGAPEMDCIPASALPAHSIHEEPTPERRHAALALMNIQSALHVITRRLSSSSLHDILKDHWCEKKVVTYDHQRRKIFKHHHFRIGGSKVLQYYTMSLRLPDENDPLSFAAVGSRTIYWMKTGNDHVRALIVDNEFIQGSRDVAVIIEDLDSVRVLSEIEDEINKDHEEDRALQKRLSNTTLQDLNPL